MYYKGNALKKKKKGFMKKLGITLILTGIVIIMLMFSMCFSDSVFAHGDVIDGWQVSHTAPDWLTDEGKHRWENNFDGYHYHLHSKGDRNYVHAYFCCDSDCTDFTPCGSNETQESTNTESPATEAAPARQTSTPQDPTTSEPPDNESTPLSQKPISQPTAITENTNTALHSDYTNTNQITETSEHIVAYNPPYDGEYVPDDGTISRKEHLWRGETFVYFPFIPDGIVNLFDLYNKHFCFLPEDKNTITVLRDGGWIEYDGSSIITTQSIGYIRLIPHDVVIVKTKYGGWFTMKGKIDPREEVELSVGLNAVGFTDYPSHYAPSRRFPSDLLSDAIVSVMIAHKGKRYTIRQKYDYLDDHPLSRYQGVFVEVVKETTLELKKPVASAPSVVRMLATSWGSIKKGYR